MVLSKENKTRIKRNLSELIQILIGIVLASIGLKGFLLPNGFLDGGVTGIAILASMLLDVNVSIVLVLVSVPFLVLAGFTLSKKILIKSIFSILGLALFIHFENFPALTGDKLLTAIFGGLFLGSGIGVTIKNGAVLDGSEILGVFLHDKLGVSIGKVVLFFNLVLFGVTAFFLSTEVAMYSVLTFLVTAKVIDFMIKGFEDYVGLMIVSEKIELIEVELINTIGAGLTVYCGQKGHGVAGTRKNVDIVHTVINRIDIRRTYNHIIKIDPKAFILEFDVNNVQGGKLRQYLNKAGIKHTIGQMTS